MVSLHGDDDAGDDVAIRNYRDIYDSFFPWVTCAHILLSIVHVWAR